jgi:hypothetical protein
MVSPGVRYEKALEWGHAGALLPGHVLLPSLCRPLTFNWWPTPELEWGQECAGGGPGGKCCQLVGLGRGC